jgi:predicted nucleic acid binding AN1-type Zn finger protein
MEFAELGTHCSVLNCRQQDFLPFECDACRKVYCRDHRSYMEHRCGDVPMGEEVVKCPACSRGITKLPGVDINLTISQHMDSPECAKEEVAKCPKCSVKLTGINSVTCKKCKQKVCIAHRYADQHPCTHPLERKVAGMGFKCPRCAINFEKSAMLIQHMRFDHYQNK